MFYRACLHSFAMMSRRLPTRDACQTVIRILEGYEEADVELEEFEIDDFVSSTRRCGLYNSGDMFEEREESYESHETDTDETVVNADLCPSLKPMKTETLPTSSRKKSRI